MQRSEAQNRGYDVFAIKDAIAAEEGMESKEKMLEVFTKTGTHVISMDELRSTF